MIKKIRAHMIVLICVLLGIFQLYTSATGILEPLLQRPIHLALLLGLAFLLYPCKKEAHALDVAMSILSMIAIGYIAANYNDIITRMNVVTNIELILGITTLLLLFEATRRTNGFPLVVIALAFLLFAFFGPYMPDAIAHRGYGIRDIIYYMYISTQGIFSTPIAVSSTYIYLFIFFGAVLEKTGMGELFNDLALSLLGHFSGGPAKVSVIASGLMGTINGSAIANVATTGSFTIPLMKKIGYQPDFAAAVEAVSSVGGYIMPPIMASTAFIMAEMLQIPYFTIVKAAVIPAFLYYLSVIFMVHLRAKKLNLQGIPKNELPQFTKTLRERGFLLLPIILLVTLLMKGFTPIFAGTYSIVAAIVVSFFSPKTRLKKSDILDIFILAGKNTVSVAIACGIVGVIMGVATLSGFGLKVASAIIQLGHGNIGLTLLFTMLACLILGMGLPSIPTYILTATMASPALVTLGFPSLAAHMFVFYFGSMANLTPPVALAAYTGAGIAGSDPTKTGFTAMKLALAGFLVPFMFVMNPQMLGIQSTVGSLLLLSLIGILVVVSVATSVEGFAFGKKINNPLRIVLFAASILMISSVKVFILAGITAVFLSFLIQRTSFFKK